MGTVHRAETAQHQPVAALKEGGTRVAMSAIARKSESQTFYEKSPDF